MKRINRLLQFVLSLSLVTSCVESDEAVDLASMPRQTITIEASQEARRVETRTTLQTDGSVFWNPSDEISLFFNSGTNGGDKFVSQNSENVAIAEFSGSIQGITGGGENLEENAYFWAVYPYSEGNSCDGSSIVTTLPYKQQAVEGTFADDLFITIARSPSVRMAFKNVCGGVKFCVSKSGIESVIFRGNSGENLAGKVRVSFDENNKPAVTEVIDGQSEVVVTAPNGGTFEPGKYYYIITLPTPLESGFEMIFRKSDNTKIVYKRTSGVVINRSRFGVVENVDSGEAVPDDTPTGGSESGFYLGIIGFNNGLYTYPIQHLSNRSIAGYNSFIDGLTTINGTLLYYAVDKSIDHLQAATFPSNLYDVSIVTFTDGLDRGSLDEGGYLSNTEYLAALNTRLTGEKVSDKSITAYSIGVRGDDVTNYTSFQNNLKNLATSNDNVFEVSDMSEVNEVFLKIADLLGETKYFQKLTLKIKGPSHNEKCRFTFDNVSSYNSSQCYIEGTFNRIDKTLTDVKYVGLSSDSGTVINSYKNEENFYVFTFDGVQAADGTLVPTDNVLHWYTEGGVWEKDSEFDFDPGDVSVEKIERSAAIILNLDCSSSLEGDAFATLQRHAKSFIAKLCENITDPYEAASISLNQTAVTMVVGTNKTLSATVLPTTAVRKDVEYSSTNAAVASVDKNGKITAHKPGAATIIARTKDGGHTAACNTTVLSNERIIWYTSTDGKIVTPHSTTAFGGANIVSNTYEDNQGVIIFDAPVTEIGSYAFDHYRSLTSITIPDSVTTLGDNPFAGCSKLTEFNGKFASADKRCLIVDGVLNSFAIGCGLTEYTIPDSVTEIGDWAFGWCSSLTSVTIPDSVTEIGSEAFYDCNRLASVTIPDSVTTLGYNPFQRCSNLTEFNGKFASTDKRCLIVDGILNSFAPAGLTEYTIPDSITEIGDSAFECCSSLTSVTIPNSVSSIGDYAFQYCSSLTSITIPNSVTTIGYSAFEFCSNLTSVTIPDSVTVIGDYAFEYCSSLTSVTIPDSVTEIGTAAFGHCNSLTSVTIPDSVTEIGGGAFRYCSSLTSVIIPNSVTEIGSSAFRYCSSLTSVIIPNSVTEIGSSAFYDCSSLTSVTIPDSVTEIGSDAFYSCSSLKSVYCNAAYPPNLGSSAFGNTALENIYVYAESVDTYKAKWSDYADKIVSNNKSNSDSITFTYTSTDGKAINESNLNLVVKSNSYTNGVGTLVVYGTAIPDKAFYQCTTLKTITIPNSVSSIGDYTFYKCSSLTSVTIPNSVTTIGYSAFRSCSSIKSITIPNSVTEIGISAFVYCSSLTTITIPDSVTEIGYGAFNSCSSLTSVTIGNSVTTLGYNPFEGCSKLTEFNGKFASADKRCLIVDGVLNSFAPAGLTEYTIPNSVTKIGNSAFNGCSNLTSVTIPDSVTEIGVSAFRNCSSLTSVTIPNSVTSIGNSAFESCSSLTSVTIGNSVTTLGYNPFEGCSKLTEFNGKFASADKRCLIVDGVLNSFAPAGLTEYTIPDSVTSIGGSAFGYCSSLTSVTIPDSVTTIRNYAFEDCSSLKSVYCKPAIPPQGGVSMFYYNATGRKIYVPRASESAYEVAGYWRDYAADIEPYDFE